MRHDTSRENLFPWFRTIDDLTGLIDWSEFYGNSNPVELDVGSGRGLHLVTAGQSNPHINYLGIEIDYKEGRRAAKRLKKREIANTRVLGGDVNRAFNNHFAPHSVDAIHVYFPDPWWKRRHRRRRLFTDLFADRLSRTVKPGGLIHSWTDVKDYFEVIQALMDHHPGFEVLPPPEEREPLHDLDYQTSFERKKRQAGETIFRGLWRRKST